MKKNNKKNIPQFQNRDEVLAYIENAKHVFFEDAIFDGYRSDKAIALKAYEKNYLNFMFWSESILYDKEFLLEAYLTDKRLFNLSLAYFGNEIKELLKDVDRDSEGDNFGIEIILRGAIQQEKRNLLYKPGKFDLSTLLKAIKNIELATVIDRSLSAKSEQTKQQKIMAKI